MEREAEQKRCGKHCSDAMSGNIDEPVESKEDRSDQGGELNADGRVGLNSQRQNRLEHAASISSLCEQETPLVAMTRASGRREEMVSAFKAPPVMTTSAPAAREGLKEK